MGGPYRNKIPDSASVFADLTNISSLERQVLPKVFSHSVEAQDESRTVVYIGAVKITKIMGIPGEIGLSGYMVIGKLLKDGEEKYRFSFFPPGISKEVHDKTLWKYSNYFGLSNEDITSKKDRFVLRFERRYTGLKIRSGLTLRPTLLNKLFIPIEQEIREYHKNISDFVMGKNE